MDAKIDAQGLTSREAAEILKRIGPNTLGVERGNVLLKIFRLIISPVSLMLLATALVSYLAGKEADAWIILSLFGLNIGISIIHEWKADTSIKSLEKHLIVKARVKRDGEWQAIASPEIVPGDVVELSVGKVVPADLEIIEAKNLSLNESLLTGESLPREKSVSDAAYSGSFVATGYALGRVSSTGKRTYFGKTLSSVDISDRRSALEEDILSISKLIALASLVVIIILTAALFFAHAAWSDITLLDLSLLIAGVPVALPTVMSLIIGIGVLELSKRQVIVRRLGSLEDLANVDLLLSDKTGTLTENKIRVERVVAVGEMTEAEVLRYAASTVSELADNPLEAAVAERAREASLKLYTRSDFTPGDSERKRATAILASAEGERCVSLGAAQVVMTLCNIDETAREQARTVTLEAARGGFRVLALSIAKGREEQHMRLGGFLFLADRVRSDAAETIRFMESHGIEVKMLTGDSLPISERVAADLGLHGSVHGRDLLSQGDAELNQAFESAAGFAEVLPEDKYRLVELAEKGHVVAVTGDGVNDLPAVKAANVGFAVANAVDALKGTADIVLLSPGIAVIEEAIIEARKIFARLYNYSVYRISESFRIIITIAVVGLLYRVFPLTPVELIVLAFLNDVPIVSLAFDRIDSSPKPSRVDAKKRFTLSGLFGLAGVANSLVLLFIMLHILHLSWPIIQTVFFLKLTVSGHMLIYVAHTEKRWYKFLPSWEVIAATIGTQLIATALALLGIFTAPIGVGLVVLVWVWTFLWMQITELVKVFVYTYVY